MNSVWFPTCVDPHFTSVNRLILGSLKTKCTKLLEEFEQEGALFTPNQIPEEIKLEEI